MISGTLMLLSDNYGPYGKREIIALAKERAKQFADQEELNGLARSNTAFRPLVLNDRNDIFYAEGYLAVFNYGDEEKTYEIDPSSVGLPTEGTLLDLNRKKKIPYRDQIQIRLKAYDSVILKLL